MANVANVIENIVKIQIFEVMGNSLLAYVEKLITLESITIMPLIAKMMKSASLLVSLKDK